MVKEEIWRKTGIPFNSQIFFRNITEPGPSQAGTHRQNTKNFPRLHKDLNGPYNTRKRLRKVFQVFSARLLTCYKLTECRKDASKILALSLRSTDSAAETPGDKKPVFKIWKTQFFLTRTSPKSRLEKRQLVRVGVSRE